MRNNLLEVSSLPDVEKLKHSFFQVIEESGLVFAQESHQNLEGIKYGKTAKVISSLPDASFSLPRRSDVLDHGVVEFVDFFSGV